MRRWMVLGVLVAALVGCGGDDDGGSTAPAADLPVPWVDPDGDAPIVGSLSVNLADSSLFMGTNTGLFRVPEGASKPEKLVGTLKTPDGSGKVSEALVVRFVGPDELLGSGHPSAGAALPPALGLIRSDDAGKTWSSVSEMGTVHFHAIEPAGDEIVAALFQQAQVLVSNDDGRTWATRAAPLPLIALEVNPDDPQHWIGSTERGIFLSEAAARRGASAIRRRTSDSPGPTAASSTGSTPAGRSRWAPTAARAGRTAGRPAVSRRR